MGHGDHHGWSPYWWGAAGAAAGYGAAYMWPPSDESYYENVEGPLPTFVLNPTPSVVSGNDANVSISNPKGTPPFTVYWRQKGDEDWNEESDTSFNVENGDPGTMTLKLF